jgi:flavin reductase (DIM6/NTAB) family NADH-FMN oxidoreductase RutF
MNARVAVDLPRAYLLINHGPTVLVSSAHGGQRNVMAAAWNMALDFTPAKVVVVVAKSTLTRQLIESSGEFALNMPTLAQAQLTTAVGYSSGRSIDKQATLGVQYFEASKIGAPLVEGCSAWLECKLMAEPEMAHKYDLLFGEVVAAWADSRVWHNNRWQFDAPENASLRRIHHVAGGTYLVSGRQVVTKA